MDTRTEAKVFLSKHNFSTDIADNLHKDILQDMYKGLTSGNADQAMIKAGKTVNRTINEGENVIVIDAGGTNFRSCLVTKTQNGIEISEFEKTSMPAIERKLSKKEFYSAIANNISRLKDCSDKISFCFSYAMEITENGDGKILRFSKEIKAEEAVGTYIGKELLAELKNQGWAKIKKINVLNDTTALLLSSYVSENKNWGKHIAFILGTGMNSAYIKKEHIIVTECGMYSALPQSDFDLIVCGRTRQPDKSILEKMCSGAYLGEIAFEMLIKASFEGLFSESFASEIKKLDGLTTADFDSLFIEGKSSCLSEIIKQGSEKDIQLLKELITAIISRSANLTAEAIYSAIIASDYQDKEKEELPVCITCNGSTFWKTPLLKEKVENRLKTLLPTDFEIIKIEDDITKGSFAAAFI